METAMYRLSKRWYLKAAEERRRELEQLSRSSNHTDADRARAVLDTLDEKINPLIATGLSARPRQIDVVALFLTKMTAMLKAHG